MATLNGHSRDLVVPQRVRMHTITRSGPLSSSLHRHSSESVSVEAPAIEIVVVIAHAILFQLSLFLSHHVKAILVVVQVNLAVQDAPEVCQEDKEEHQDHQRRLVLVVMESLSHLLLRFRV